MASFYLGLACGVLLMIWVDFVALRKVRDFIHRLL
jgi:hypothetical protein